MNLIDQIIKKIKKRSHLAGASRVSRQAHLRLPQLRILFLYNLIDGHLNVDAPNLRVVGCETYLDKIRLQNPESVRELHLCFFDVELTAYPNVKLLTVQQAHTFPSSLSCNLLKRLPQLNEIRIQFKPTYGDRNYYSIIDFNLIRKALFQLLDERESLNAKTAIRFEHVLLYSTDQLEQLRKDQFVC